MTTPRHRVSAATAQMRAAAASVADASVWSMTEIETASTLVELVRLKAQITELEARVALAAGEIHVDQARVILKWVDRLPDDVGAELRDRAEQHLLHRAAEHDATALDRLGKHVFEVIDPDAADAHAPKHQAATKGAGATAERLHTPEAMGRALCELITRYPVKKLPNGRWDQRHPAGPHREDSLVGRIEKAGILPVVLGGDSMPLDVGREQRLYTRHQRIAMFVRDRGCRAHGCHRVTGLHAHHQQEWANGGPTDLTKGVSLCPWHHARAHDTAYKTTYHANGRVEFHRRT